MLHSSCGAWEICANQQALIRIFHFQSCSVAAVNAIYRQRHILHSRKTETLVCQQVNARSPTRPPAGTPPTSWSSNVATQQRSTHGRTNPLTYELVVTEAKVLQVDQPPKLLRDGTCANTRQQTNTIAPAPCDLFNETCLLLTAITTPVAFLRKIQKCTCNDIVTPLDASVSTYKT